MRNPSAFVVHALSRQEGLTQEVKDLKLHILQSHPVQWQDNCGDKCCFCGGWKRCGWHLSLLGCGGHDFEMCFAPQRRAIFQAGSAWRAYFSTLTLKANPAQPPTGCPGSFPNASGLDFQHSQSHRGHLSILSEV